MALVEVWYESYVADLVEYGPFGGAGGVWFGTLTAGGGAGGTSLGFIESRTSFTAHGRMSVESYAMPDEDEGCAALDADAELVTLT